MPPDPQLNNWQRWGATDEIGTANLITPGAIVHAARLVRRGVVFSCAAPLDDRGPVYPGRLPPKHMMSVSGSDYEAGQRGMGSDPEGGIKFADDYLFAALQCSTQWDALSHAWYGTELYNGFSQREIRGTTGARRLGIEKMYKHFVGRGILLDVVRALDAGERLQPGYAITAEDLNRATQQTGLSVESGDIVLVRTGHLPWFYTLKDKSEFWKGAPGLGRSTTQWLQDHGVSAVALDNIAAEVQPAESEGGILPLHGVLIRDLGMTIGEMFHLEELAADCQKDGVYEFLFVGQPLRITGAVGSPINPLAIK
jgi:kynurenine formamidase